MTKAIYSSQAADQPVQVTGEVTGLAKGLHGFHIHEFGDVTNGKLVQFRNILNYLVNRHMKPS